MVMSTYNPSRKRDREPEVKKGRTKTSEEKKGQEKIK